MAIALLMVETFDSTVIRAVQLTVFQLIINGNKFVTFNRTNRLITAVISDPLHSL